jgi:Sigma-70, region 4
VGVSVAASVALGVLLVGKWDELAGGLTGASVLVVATAVALQVVALVSRTEAWHVCVRASGGTVGRRRLYRVSSVGCVGNLLNAQLGTAARIAVLRRVAPEESPRVPALIAAELPILTVEVMLAALFSFTLVGPLGLPWWIPLVALAAVVGMSAGLRRLAGSKWRWLGQGLAVMRSLQGRNRLLGFVLVAVFAQIARNWLLLHAVGIDASLFDAIAVLIAVVSLGQLPFGLSVGAAASVMILGPEGVTAAAAAGVLLTATGTVGGLCFAAWAGLDALCDGRLRSVLPAVRGHAPVPWTALAALPARRRRAVEHAYFGGLSHLQITRVLGVAPTS